MRDQGTVCGICGGDGRIANAFGSHTTCPGCHGSGHHQEATGFRDVTKTKPSHFKTERDKAAATGPRAPTTPSGTLLANEINASLCSPEVKARLIRETVDHEDTHGLCTQTFVKKMRKQLKR
jgi:hypothetical protein